MTNKDADTIDVICIKTKNVVNKDDVAYLGNEGININNYKVIGKYCKDNKFKVDNPSWCYFYVTFFEEFVKKLKSEKIDSKNMQIRLKELLGLREEWGPYTHLVLLNVDKSRLFRPCYNKPSIDETSCDIKPNSAFKDYNIWFDAYRQNSVLNKIPFTGVGYTYDWLKGNSDDIKGVTEMIIEPGTVVNIKYIYKIDDFINNILQEP